MRRNDYSPLVYADGEAICPLFALAFRTGLLFVFSDGNYYCRAFSRDSGPVLTCRDPGVEEACTRLRAITRGESLKPIVAGFTSGYAE